MNRNPLSPSPAPENATPSAPELPPEWVDRVLARLAAIFGSKMAALYAGQHPDVVRAAWSRGLAGCTGDQLAAAINASSRKPWPPTLQEFVALTQTGPRRTPVFAPRMSEPAVPGRERTAANRQGAGKTPPAWAQRILLNPARYPEVSLAFARDAIRACGGRACSPS